MSDLERTLQDPAIVRSVRRRYFHNECKYDSWGAQGRVLVVLETLTAVGFNTNELSVQRVDLERVVNDIFPRTFVCPARTLLPPEFAQAVRERYAEIISALSDYVADANNQHRISCEETAATLNLPVEQVEEIVASPDTPGADKGVSLS